MAEQKIINNLKAKVSSLLFVSSKPLSTEKIASVCNSNENEIVDTIEDLKKDLELLSLSLLL